MLLIDRSRSFIILHDLLLSNDWQNVRLVMSGYDLGILHNAVGFSWHSGRRGDPVGVPF